MGLLTNRYFWIALLWSTSITATAYGTWDYATAKADQDKLAAVQRAIEQQRKLDAETLEIEVAAAEQRQQVQIIYRDRIKKVTEYVEKNPDRVQCLNPDGLQLFNAIGTGVENAGSHPLRTSPPTP